MNNLLRRGVHLFGIALICAALAVLAPLATPLEYLIAQALTLSTQAQIPTTSPGGTVNLLSDMPQWLTFNTDSHGTRTYVPVGSALGSTFTATDETTGSTSFVDLTTHDAVTFTCAATCTVAVWYNANCYNVGGGATAIYNAVFVDAVQADDGNQVILSAGASGPLTCSAIWKAASLSAASHTIDIQHKVSANTGHWRDRMITVSLSQ